MSAAASRMRIIGLVALAVALAAPATAAADTFNVTGSTDVAGPCQGSSCPSIRAALAAAQPTSGADTILVPAGSYQLTQGALTVNTAVTIRGAGARVTTIVGDPQQLQRVFDVSPGVSASFTRLTMAGGTAGSHNGFWGGNLRNNGGTVLLDHVRVTNGSASSGGGVGNIAGTMTIQHSLIDGNRALTNGADSGGIQNFGSETTAGVLTVRDSTVAFNTAQLAGGILSWGNPNNVTTLERVTVAYNSGGFRGTGGIGSSFAGEAFRVRGSIVAHNTVNSAPSNCGSVIPISDGGNVVSNDDCGFTAAGDVQNADPLLSAETVDAGGETDILTIGPASPALDRAGGCSGADQRDLPRPQGGACDAGAYEIDRVPDTSLTTTPGLPGGAPTFTFASSEPGVRFECRLDGPGGPGAFAPCASPTTYSGLAPGAYAFSVRAVDGSGAADPSPATAGFAITVVNQSPEPEFHETVVVRETRGRVRVRLKGSDDFVPLDEAQSIPLGSTVDTRKGVVVLSSEPRQGAEPQSARFYAGIFRVTQSGSVTNLKLTEKLRCPKAGEATISAKRKKKRRLWGDGSGRFRTSGEYSSATVRGTKWLVEDRCTSTLTRVVRGRVTVRDFVKKKTVIVRAGKRYVAKRRG